MERFQRDKFCTIWPPLFIFISVCHVGSAGIRTSEQQNFYFIEGRPSPLSYGGKLNNEQYFASLNYSKNRPIFKWPSRPRTASNALTLKIEILLIYTGNHVEAISKLTLAIFGIPGLFSILFTKVLYKKNSLLNKNINFSKF